MSEQSSSYLQSIPARPIISGLVISRVKADGSHGNTKIEVTIAVHDNQNIAADIPKIIAALDILATPLGYHPDYVEEQRKYLAEHNITAKYPDALEFGDFEAAECLRVIDEAEQHAADHAKAIALLAKFGYQPEA